MTYEEIIEELGKIIEEAENKYPVRKLKNDDIVEITCYDYNSVQNRIGVDIQACFTGKVNLKLNRIFDVEYGKSFLLIHDLHRVMEEYGNFIWVISKIL